MIDIVKISVKAGGGGNGCISFRREKFVPKGGPDGGDGGAGGSVFIVGDPSLNTLLHLKYHSTWRGMRGVHGSGNKKRGANGEHVTIPVPIGTVVWRLAARGDPESSPRQMIADITDTEPVLMARGGRGGAGNARFVSSVQQEPVLAEKGEEGEGATLLLELKLLADVGIIGQPNAGKSTLLSRCSAAKPKIAPYPFTTTDPVLGVVSLRNSTFVMMEVPGLIEGAHRGAGLGHEFLRHTERARLLLHLLDGLSEDPLGDWQRINHELVSFDPSLGQKPQIIVVNKLDITEVRERMPAIRSQFGSQSVPVFFVSAATGEGVDALLGKVLEALESLPTPAPQPLLPSPIGRGAGGEGSPQRREGPQGRLGAPREDRAFRVVKENGVYVVYAPRVERLLPLADLKDWRAVVQIWRELERLGVAKALEEQGVQPGDTVRLANVELEWF